LIKSVTKRLERNEKSIIKGALASLGVDDDSE
jgi:hypothetical protein